MEAGFRSHDRRAQRHVTVGDRLCSSIQMKIRLGTLIGNFAVLPCLTCPYEHRERDTGSERAAVLICA